MPTYDYRCRSCDHAFEAMQPITAEPLKECPMCGGAVKRLVGGGIGLIFKGSGFYITDYGRKGGGGNGGGSIRKQDAGTKGGTSADAPSAEKPEPAAPAKEPSGTKPAGPSD